MAGSSAIEWTDSTWNPTTGCSRVSEGCRNCYAERMASTRLRGSARYATVSTAKGWTGLIQIQHDMFDVPKGWRAPRRVFVDSMSDLFHPGVPRWVVWRVFATMAATPQHQYQVLTKRPERMKRILREGRRVVNVARKLGQKEMVWISVPLPNVWLGVSVEDQATADERIPALLDTPAAVRFISAEPMLGPIRLNNNDLSGAMSTLLDWIIAGGESGPGARPMHPDWPRGLRDQAVAVGVPFFFKQWGAWAPHHNGRPFIRVARSRYEPESCAFFPDGTRYNPTRPDELESPSLATMYRIGKRLAGRELDGRTWTEWPNERNTSEGVTGSRL